MTPSPIATIEAEDWSAAAGVISRGQSNQALAPRDYGVACKTTHLIVVIRGYQLWWCSSHCQPRTMCVADQKDKNELETAGKLLVLESRIEAELAVAERRAWECLTRFKYWQFGYWASVWSIINRLGNLGRNTPWRELTSDAVLQVSQLSARESKDNGNHSIRPE